MRPYRHQHLRAGGGAFALIILITLGLRNSKVREDCGVLRKPFSIIVHRARHSRLVQLEAPSLVRRLDGQASCEAVSDELQRLMQEKKPVLLTRLKEAETMGLQIAKDARVNASYRCEVDSTVWMKSVLSSKNPLMRVVCCGRGTAIISPESTFTIFNNSTAFGSLAATQQGRESLPCQLVEMGYAAYERHAKGEMPLQYYSQEYYYFQGPLLEKSLQRIFSLSVFKCSGKLPYFRRLWHSLLTVLNPFCEHDLS